MVLLATPPMDRYQEAISVFSHGCHLLSEKPLTLDFDEGIRIVKAAEDANRTMVVGLNFRYQHVVTHAKKLWSRANWASPVSPGSSTGQIGVGTGPV